jgi:uncharacterized protein (TIGR03435 family)
MSRRQTWLVPFVVVAAILMGGTTDAQIPPAAPGQERADVSFDVASVAETGLSRRTAASTLRMHPSGLFQAIQVSLRQLIMVAYDVADYQIVAGPEWMRTDLFDIVAKAPEDFEMGHTKAMIRKLLEKRFGLVIREEKRVMPTYSLEWVDGSRKLGPWFRLPSRDCDVKFPPRPLAPPGRRTTTTASADSPECGIGAGINVGGWVWLRRSPLSAMVGFLRIEVDRPVIDKTGLAGAYDVDLKYSPARRLVPAAVVGNVPDLGGGVSIFTAVREQLGLKLEPMDGEVEVLAIERLERPTPN